jgi:hypothetical protein
MHFNEEKLFGEKTNLIIFQKQNRIKFQKVYSIFEIKEF